MHKAVLTHAPIPFAASAGFVNLAGIHSQLDEVAPSGARPVASASLHPCGAACRLAVSLRSAPLFPIVEPHSPPDPFVQLQHSSAGVADAKVVHPPHGVAAQFVDDVLHGVTAVAAGDFFDLQLEPRECLCCPLHLSPAIDLKAEELALAQGSTFALEAVDVELEFVFDIVGHACHDALRGLRASHQDDEVVGVAGMMMPAAFEFFIEWIEHSRAAAVAARQTAALERSGRVKEPEEATESTFASSGDKGPPWGTP